MTENRVLILAEKINSLKIGHKAEAERKIDCLEKQVNDLETDFERMMGSFNDKHYELKHIVHNLQHSSPKSVNKSPSITDKLIALSKNNVKSVKKWLCR